MVIVVRGYDGVPVTELPQGRELLERPHRMTHELPRESSTLDITLPH